MGELAASISHDLNQPRRGSFPAEVRGALIEQYLSSTMLTRWKSHPACAARSATAASCGAVTLELGIREYCRICSTQVANARPDTG
jgi:hypothetical protein